MSGELVVSCPPEVQVPRVMARDGVYEAQARQTLAAQLPLAEKEAVATYVIRNEGGLSELEEEVARVAGAIGLSRVRSG